MFKLFAAIIVVSDASLCPAIAGERTITLAVENMYCAACPYIVRNSLQAVTGVLTVDVSFEDKTAKVSFDDAKADVAALVKATRDAGYPSAPKS